MSALDSHIVSNRARAEQAYKNSAKGAGLNPEYISTTEGQKPKAYKDGTGLAFGSYPTEDGLIQKVQWNDNTDSWDDFGDPEPTRKYVNSICTVDGILAVDGNDNFRPIYPSKSHWSSKEDAIQEAIRGTDTSGNSQTSWNGASANGGGRVVLSEHLLPYDATSVSFDPSVRMIREENRSEVYDLFAYGGYSNASNDDGPAWAAMANAAEAGDIIYRPSGNDVSIVGSSYVPIAFSGGVILQGSGWERGSRVRLGPNADTNLFESESAGSGTDVDEIIVVRDLAVEGNKSNNTAGSGFVFQSEGSRFFNVRARNFEDHGFYVKDDSGGGVNGTLFDSCEAKLCNGYGFRTGSSVFDTIFDSVLSGNNSEAQIRVDSGLVQFSNMHLFAGMVSGSASTPGRGLETRTSEVHFNDSVIEKTQREAIRVTTNGSNIKVIALDGVHIENCCQEADNTYDAIHLEATDSSDVIRELKVSGVRVDSPGAANVPRYIVGGSGGGFYRRLNIAASEFADYGSGAVDSSLYTRNQVQQSAVYLEDDPCYQNKTTTIPDGSSSTTQGHDLKGSPDMVLATAHSVATVGITARTASEVTVERNGTTGSLDVDLSFLYTVLE